MSKLLPPIRSRNRTPVWLAAFMVFACAPAAAHHHEQEEPTSYFTYDPAGATVDAQLVAPELHYDADLAFHDGQWWVAWLELLPDQGDRILLGRPHESPSPPPIEITPRPGTFAHPTLTRTTGGRLWLSYESDEGVSGAWDVRLVELDKDLQPIRSLRVSDSVGVDIHHRVVPDADGGLWFVWQSDAKGQFDVLARHFQDNRLQPIELVSQSFAGDWHPSLALRSDGSLHVLWDTYQNDSFDVAYAHRDAAGEWSDVNSLAATPAFEGRANIAADADDRLWVLWESGAENWGQPYRAGRGQRELYVDLDDVRGPLHRHRRLHLACAEPGQPFHALRDALPQPSHDAAQQRASGAQPHGAYYERGRLQVDAVGRLWVIYRHNYAPWMGIEPHHHVEQGFGLYARCLTDRGWSDLFRFSIDQGDGMQRLETAPTDDGFVALWTAGRTDRRENKLPRGVAFAKTSLAAVRPAESPVTAANLADEPLAITPASDGSAEPTHPAPFTVGQREFHVALGDLHRHTDLSLCFVPVDGTSDDAYRYAIEVAHLDFLGITDHARDLAFGDALSLIWHRSRKQVTRHRLSDVFLPLVAYERSRGETDHNVISLRTDMLRPHDYPHPQFWKELDQDTFTIPHQPVNRVLWQARDDVHRPLMEIFQGFRDRSVEPDAHAGLDAGHLFGFIASSDHLSTSASYAGVWTPRRETTALFRSLQARRTYGATAPIRLAVHSAGHWMGEEFTADAMPPLEIHAVGTAPIRRVDFVVDGKTTDTLTPNRRRLDLTHQLSLSGRHYVYVHLEQSDGNRAWSSPLWIDVASGD